MKFQRVLLYLGVLLAVGAYIYFIEIKQKGERQAQEEKAKKIFQVDKDKITEITLESSKGRIMLQKPAGLWVVAEPVKTAADKTAVEVILDTIADASSEKVVLDKDVKWEDYGLDKPEFTVTVVEGDKRTVAHFGFSNPGKTSYYLRVEGDSRLLLVQDTLKNALNKSLIDVRDKTVVGLATDDVERIVFVKNGKEIELRREGPEKWRMIKPEHFVVKKSLVRTAVRTLTSMNAKDIIDEPVKEGDVYGLENPEEIFTLEGKGRERTLLVGKAESKEGDASPGHLRFAKIKGNDVVYKIDERLLNGIKMDPDILRDRTLLDFNPTDVEKVEIELDGKQWAAVQGKDNKWNLEKPEKKEKIDTWLVTAVLWDIRDLEWKSILKPIPHDLASLWLDKPRLRASIYVKGGGQPYTLSMGWKPDAPKSESGTKLEGNSSETPLTEEASKPTPPGSEDSKSDVEDTVHALAHPTDEQEALFVLDMHALTRLKADLERLNEKK